MIGARSIAMLVLLGAPLSGAEPALVGDAWNDPRNPIRTLFAGQRLDLWSLKPVPRVEPPAARPGESTHPIDRLLRAAALPSDPAPVPEADRRTLARRVTFDLTGLPPTEAEVAAFESDPAPDAYERVVDRLLASPRHGEHQARLWLDVVRYSDSNGFDWDEFRPRAWRYRDYVVRAFNEDKPFDRFVREQLAGDELVPGEPRDRDEQDAWVATGFLRMGPHDSAAPLFNEQDRSRNELLTDLVETTTGAFLGLTFSCCRCHDHKFDPFSQADHYRMRAFFEPVAFADDVALDLAREQEEIRRHNAALDAPRAAAEKRRDAALDASRARIAAARAAKPSDAEARDGLTAAEKETVAASEREMKSLDAARRAFTKGLLASDGPGKPPATRVLVQGNHRNPREEVTAGFPSVLDPNPAAIAAAPNPKTTGRRLALANWIASPANPLTARVQANRVWQQHFGTALVATPNDFGLAGARPTHPALLDWLADAFMRDGWSARRLHRLVVTSAAYRRGSGAGDGAGNASYWRQNPRRLSAEQLRDALLATAGTLRQSAGGTPVWPALPADVLRANPAFLDDNETRTKGWYPSPPSQQDARSVYLVQKRTVRVPFMETFDLPENSTSCARRAESIVAPQALSLLNSPEAAAAARAFAARVERAAGPGSDAARRVETAFRIAFQRTPTAGERARCEAWLATRTLPEFCRALLNLNEFVYLD